MRRNRRRRAARYRERQSIRITVVFVSVVFLVMFFLHPKGYAKFHIPMGGQATVPGSTGQAASGTSEPPPVAEQLGDDDLARLRVNELGKVMIIMYHDVQEYEAEWVRSNSNFRKDLQRFYDLGYSLVPLSGYLTGNLQVPAGRAPLVLTFDDGTRGQFSMTQENEGTKTVPDPDSAVGILLQFAREHADFGQAATFFINSGNPFGDALRVKENLSFLLENGMEIGNHTRSHGNLKSASPDEVAEEIGSLANEIKEVCGYDVISLALPFGGYPSSEENLLHGTWDGRDYANKGILLVGAEPAPSPFSTKFNPLAIPRIRGSQGELDKWLRQFDKYPDGRFVSDGQSETVTVPKSEDGDLDLDRVGELNVRTYPSDAQRPRT